jgi:zinc finger protein
LSQDQDRRKEEHPEESAKIEEFLSRVRLCMKAETPFTLILHDISGNSFISPPPSVLPGHKDERLQSIRVERTREEDHLVGIYPEMAEEDTTEQSDSVEESGQAPDFHQEVLEFSTTCPNCGAACTTKMKLTPIPYFKEVVIMATDCEKCGSRTNEVKSGSGIEEKGRRITLRVTTPDDLCRDVLKSETCSVEIPELELEVGGGTLGGKFTTLEGLLCNLKEQLSAENPLISGDSAYPEMKAKMEQFCQKFDRLISCEVPFTVILDDPAGNSYLQNVYAPDDDPEMKVEDYERDFEQREQLGLNDINTENYSADQ